MDVKSLKTLKDVCHWIPLNFDIDDDAFLARDLKDAACEWIKYYEEDYVSNNANMEAIAWIKHFFNLDDKEQEI